MSPDSPTPDVPRRTPDQHQSADQPSAQRPSLPVDPGIGPTRTRIVTIALVLLAIAIVIAGAISRQIVASSRPAEPAGRIAGAVYAGPPPRPPDPAAGIPGAVYAGPTVTVRPAASGLDQSLPDARPTWNDVDRFNEAIAVIRSTPEFWALPDWLRENDVRFALGSWDLAPGTAAEYHADTNRVLLDVGYIRSVRPVLLASLIVHETVHAQRYLDGQVCSPCTEVVPGAILEEELPAYDAQARFLRYWVDRGELAELPMTAAHRAGDESFAWYVWYDLAQR